MRIVRLSALALVAGFAALLSCPAGAQETGKPSFAPPERIKAGDAFLGEGRLYPSPVLHDADGDGRLDIVVGDLRGMVTMARRVDEGFAGEQPMKAANGKPLKFHNW